MRRLYARRRLRSAQRPQHARAEPQTRHPKRALDEPFLGRAHADAGEAIADALWSSRSVADAVAAVTALATPEHLAAWEQPDAEARDEDEGHSSSPGKKRGGGGRRNS